MEELTKGQKAFMMIFALKERRDLSHSTLMGCADQHVPFPENTQEGINNIENFLIDIGFIEEYGENHGYYLSDKGLEYLQKQNAF